MQPTIDSTRVAAHLAGAVRIPTIATRAEGGDRAPFEALRDYLARTYPRVHAQLVRDRVGASSLHYEWAGRDPAKAHVVLMGHLDVVPVEPGTEARWTHAPWSGEIDGGFLYGRGTLDDKGAVIAILEAVEELLAEGHRPVRTLHLAFGGDEELGGARGAHQIVARLRARGITPALVLDEGGALVANQMPGVAGTAAMVGIAEKGYLTLELSVAAPGGHSSTPGAYTAIGRLSRAIARLEARPFPARLSGATAAMLRAMAPSQPRAIRLAMTHAGLFERLIVRRLLADPKTATLVRTTTAPTIFHAGATENVLPDTATAVLNFQVLTGETATSVIARVRDVVADPAIRVRAVPGSLHSEPSPVSDTSGPAFVALANAITETLGHPLVVPFLTGPTDARFWSFAGTTSVFRFTPFAYEPDWMQRAHGTDERIAVGGLADAVRFYMQLVRNTDRM